MEEVKDKDTVSYGAMVLCTVVVVVVVVVVDISFCSFASFFILVPLCLCKAVPMDHSGHSAGESLTSTIFRSLDSMFSLSQYVFTSFTTTLKTGQLLEESANCSPGPCVWSTSGSSSPSPVFSSNGVTPSSTQSTPLTPSNTLRKRKMSSQPGT